MNCIKKSISTQTEVKKSKFISFLVPYNEFRKIYQELKNKHSKANHIIYAYRYINNYNQVVENSSDDKEPKGAAGVPTLNYLRGKDLVNCAILTVRYFGGIKLGIGGMIRAYGLSAKSVIDKAEIIKYEPLIKYKISAYYNRQRQIEYYLKELNIKPINRTFLNDKVEWILNITEEKLYSLKKLLV